MYAPHGLNIPTKAWLKTPKNRLFQHLVSSHPSFDLYLTGTAKRDEVEQHIYDKYKNIYHAKLNQYMPYLLTMKSHKEFNAVLGIRIAKEAVLFVEQYSDLPIEKLILKHCNIQTDREKIIEIGNLTAVKQGSSQLLFIIIVALLYHSGYHWATFAATEDVQKITDKLGFTTYKLHKAEPKQLEGEAEQWGSYYETKPISLHTTYKLIKIIRLRVISSLCY